MSSESDKGHVSKCELVPFKSWKLCLEAILSPPLDSEPIILA